MFVALNTPANEWVESREEAEEVLKACMDAPIIAIDTETDGVDIMRSRVIIWSLAFNNRRVSLAANTLPVFTPLFEGDNLKVLHNAKFDMHMIENSCGVRMRGAIFDTVVMAVMHNTEMSEYSLKFLSGDGLFEATDPRYIKYESPFGGRIKNAVDAIASMGLEKFSNYASLDAWATLVIFHELHARLQTIPGIKKNSTLLDIYVEEELDFTHVLYDCERRGILLDVDYLNEKSQIAQKKIDELSEEFVARARMPLNIRSNPQLSNFFYEVQGRTVSKYTKGGKTGVRKPSMDESVVKAWAEEGDIFSRVLLEFRKHDKILRTYLRGWANQVDKQHRIHTTLNQGGTDTGRLSSAKPNLQNVPRPGTEKDIYRLREAFIAPEGMILVGADYDQLEMRIMAELSKEPDMINMINRGWDIHAANASMMYNVPYEDIVQAKKDKKEAENTKKKIEARTGTLLKYRQDAKAIGFGLNYGKGFKALAVDLKCGEDEARDKIARYFEPFPKVKGFIKSVHNWLHINGFVRTYSGRMRSLKDGKVSFERGKIARAERQSVNSIIQGTAADIVRLAMIYIWKSKRLRDLGARLLLQIHDELLLETPLGTEEEVKSIVKELMQKPYNDRFVVNITAQPASGMRWTDVH
jgi:DNA polymerase-1